MAALTEIGHVRIVTGRGDECLLVPSLAHIAAIGSPQEIVRTYADLHDHRPGVARLAALMVVYACAGEADPSEIVGHYAEPGPMPLDELLVIARHLMRHGIVGKQRPTKKTEGGYSDKFDASEYIDAAMIHFGMSEQDAGKLTMTQFQRMLAMKYPEKQADIPSRDEYRKRVAEMEKRKAAQNG